MKKLMWVLLFICLTGCGSDGGGSAAGGCGSKSLFSNWTHPSMIFSFAGMDFGQTYPYQTQFSTGEICQMDVQFNGSQCSGSYSVTNAAYVSGGSGDPGCAAIFNGPGTFTKSSSGLEMCDVGGCATFQ